MLRVLNDMFTGSVDVQYKLDSLECIVSRELTSSNAERDRPIRILKTKKKNNVSIQFGTKKPNKGHHRLTMKTGKSDLKKPSPKGTAQSVEVLSMTGSIRKKDILFVLQREIKSGYCSCSIKHFMFPGGRCREVSQRYQGQFNCCTDGKKVYQIFHARLRGIDDLFLVTSGERFGVRLYKNPLRLNMEDSSIYLTNEALHGPIFCFFRHGIICIQNNSLLKIGRHNNKILFYENYFKPNISHVTDLSYNPITRQLIIVCRDRTILAKFNHKNDTIKIIGSLEEVKLKIAWLHTSLVIHKNDFYPNRFKSCDNFPVPSKLCGLWTRFHL